jgi:ribosomal protein S18 acetylase RimI-like enzyme
VQGGWACVNAVNVLPAFRRQGLARSVVTALARWAAERGAAQLYLQVEIGNGGARRLYDRLGFRFAYAYHYRIRRRDGDT